MTPESFITLLKTPAGFQQPAVKPQPTFTRRDGEKKTTLTLDEVRRLALVGCVVVRHYKRRLPKLGEAALAQRLRKQGFDHATVKEILRLAQAE